MKVYCNECQHAKVCKHKQKYMTTIDTMEDKVSIPVPFELELKCPHYSANLSLYYCQSTYSGLQNAVGSSVTCSSDAPTATYNDVAEYTSSCGEA